MNDGKIVYVDVSSLSAIEGHGPKRVRWLKEKIELENIWMVPLKIEKTKYLVMDGHHRFEVAKEMGLQRVPAELFSYDEVRVWSLRSNIAVSADIILKNHEDGIIFPYKTAKHHFPDNGLKFEGVLLDELR